MNDSSGSQPTSDGPKPDAQQIRAQVETHLQASFSPANVPTEQFWNELRFADHLLDVLLDIEPMIKASLKKHPNDHDWSRILRLMQARLEIESHIPRLTARYGNRPELLDKQIARRVCVHTRRMKLRKSATPD